MVRLIEGLRNLPVKPPSAGCHWRSCIAYAAGTPPVCGDSSRESTVMDGQVLAWPVKGPAHARADNQPRPPN